MKNEHVRVTGHFHEQGSVLKGDAEGFCDGFEVEISLESGAPDVVIADMIRVSRQMCFTEKALSAPVSVQVTQKVNGKELSIG